MTGSHRARGSSERPGRSSRRSGDDTSRWRESLGTTVEPVAVGGSDQHPTRRRVRIGVQILAGVVAAAIVIGTGWTWYEYRTFSNNISVGSAITPPAGSASPTGPTYAKVEQNILLLGNDSRAGATPAELQALGTQDDGGSSNTDTMLILHIPADGSQATAISFPRDSYVQIPGFGRDKLNSAYPDGYQAAKSQGANEVTAQSAGIQVLIGTLNALTGVTINHYVQVNLLGFYRISNALGGVQVCLKNAVQEPNSGINLPAGVSTIQGTQALAFVRQRYGFPDGQGDIDRIRRQQYFLSAMFRKVLSAGTLLNPAKLSSLLNAVSSSLLIDPDLNLPALASQISDLQAGNLNFYTIPTQGFGMAGDQSIIKVDPDKVAAFVAAAFNPPPPTPTSSSASGSGTASVPGGTTTAPPTDTGPSVEGSVVPTAVNGADANCID